MNKINITWSGPYSIEEIKNSDKTGDCGVYQIYGADPVYGGNRLLYIGRTTQGTFRNRILGHKWCVATRDPENISCYLGRLTGNFSPKDEEVMIKEAESLLIYAHFPPYNTQKDLSEQRLGALKEVHVFNWDHRCDLLPEVSGARYYRDTSIKII